MGKLSWGYCTLTLYIPYGITIVLKICNLTSVSWAFVPIQGFQRLEFATFEEKRQNLSTRIKVAVVMKKVTFEAFDRRLFKDPFSLKLHSYVSFRMLPRFLASILFKRVCTSLALGFLSSGSTKITYKRDFSNDFQAQSSLSSISQV